MNSMPPSCESVTGSMRSGRAPRDALLFRSFTAGIPPSVPGGRRKVPAPRGLLNGRVPWVGLGPVHRVLRRGRAFSAVGARGGAHRGMPVAKRAFTVSRLSMSSMRASAYLTLVLALSAHAHPLAAQEALGGLEARVWLDQGEEPVLRRGEEVRVYYRTSEDAFAAIFRIDTDGRVHLIYPQHPDAVDVVRGQRDYRLLFRDAPSWRVSEDPGVGYLFVIASPEPLDFSRFPYDEWEGWDVGGVGEVVYSDPYVAIDDYVAEI